MPRPSSTSKAWLHRLEQTPAPLHAPLWRMYGRAYAPTAANPYSKARFARPRGRPLPAAITYTATTPLGALWEVVLRDAAFRQGVGGRHAVALDWHVLAQFKLAQLELGTRRSIVDLRPGARRLCIDAPSPLDHRWELLLVAERHARTHVAARGVAAQFAREGIDLGGFAYPSRQWHGATVYALYEPPSIATDWQVVEDLDLDTAIGRHRIVELLDAEGIDVESAYGAADPPSGAV